MKATILSTLALAAAVAPVLAIPPAEFKLPAADNNVELTVAYTFGGQTTAVKAAQLFGSNITSQQPQLAVDTRKFKSLAEHKGQYVVIMVDPDAPSPDKPTARFILHWMASGVSAVRDNGSISALSGQMELLQTTGKRAEVPYAPPAPPPTSAAHRYVIYAFAQPENFAVPAAFSQFSAQNRSLFNMDNFVTAAKLGKPLAAEYFYVSRQTSVQGTFIGQPGGTFPGGNGAAIFASGGGTGNGTGRTNSTTGGRGSPTALASKTSTVGMCALVGAGVLGLAMFL